MKKLALVLVLIVIFGGIFLFWDEIVNIAYFTRELFFGLPEVEKEMTTLVEEAEKQVITPEPLRALQEAPPEAPQSFLTQAGIINWTNLQREKHGLMPLGESQQLNVSSLLKAEDIIEGQYFEHISPSGQGVKDLVELIGYEFIVPNNISRAAGNQLFQVGHG